MKVFANLFKKKRNPEDSPHFIGGNGLSEKTPVGINCESMHRAEYLIEEFISEKHGQKAVDWEMGERVIFRSSKAKCGYVMSAVVKAKGEEENYYFDLSRPIFGSK